MFIEMLEVVTTIGCIALGAWWQVKQGNLTIEWHPDKKKNDEK